jgi:hypothetical protein
MDVNGARALARRIGPTEPPVSTLRSGGVSELAAPPVYHWFGIDRSADARTGDGDRARLRSDRTGGVGRFSLRRR